MEPPYCKLCGHKHWRCDRHTWKQTHPPTEESDALPIKDVGTGTDEGQSGASRAAAPAQVGETGSKTPPPDQKAKAPGPLTAAQRQKKWREANREQSREQAKARSQRSKA